ncbi:acyl-CoA dehydrogenase [Pseudohaliea sp.]|uniref:acyl-CoA dehydrogenase family protein n=1 Tax=Pseudohaliea sp. TaxID=2740289 RepID=UPI0032F07B30
MVDFSLSENDERILDAMREQSRVVRRYARYYDDNENELPPDALPEVVNFRSPYKDVEFEEGIDTPRHVLHVLVSAIQAWGDYGVLMKRIGEGLGNGVLTAAGTDEQRARWQRCTLAIAMTEPGCGSDPKSIQTTAVRDGDEWVLNGEKIFVTAGCRAEGVVVAATVDKNLGYKGIKPFVVMKGMPGFEVSHREKKMGIRADDTATLLLNNVRVPGDHLLGACDDSAAGFRAIMTALNRNRPVVGVAGVGIASAALDFTREKLKEEGIEIVWGVGKQGRSAVQQELIEIEADIEAATLGLLHAAWVSGGNEWKARPTSIAKAKAGEVARTATQRCLALLGGLGLSREYLVEKWFRDARITDLYGGTGEIQRLIIARDILGYSSAELP